jgi:hypothetical protein
MHGHKNLKFCVAISVSRTENIALAGTVVFSENLNAELNESSWHATADISKESYNISPLMY